MPDTTLNDQDQKPWFPFPPMLAYAERCAAGSARCLDVGAGKIPFPPSTHTVDLVPKPIGNRISSAVNFRQAKLPFEDKYFDFVYCRHTIEDLDDPSFLLDEIQRVGKRGYIETPSPLAELCRGIENGSPHRRGYWHHRHIVWSEGNTLMIMPKFPLIEFISLNDEVVVNMLRQNMALANTYFFWENSFKIKYVYDEEFLMKDEKGEAHPTYLDLVSMAAKNGAESSMQVLLQMTEAKVA